MTTIRSYLNLAQADVHKSLLEDEGIEVFLAGEESTRLGYGMATGPVQLQVSDEEAERARKILDVEGNAGLPDDFVPPGEVPVSAREPDNPNFGRMLTLGMVVLGAIVFALLVLPKRQTPAPLLPTRNIVVP